MATDTQSTETTDLGQELHGLDALETAAPPKRPWAVRAWSTVWPKLAATLVALALWELVVWFEWRPKFVLPPPGEVFSTLFTMLRDGRLIQATATTMERAISGFALALLIGVVVGALVSRIGIVRSAFGSFITGLQTMPSIAWFPLAMLVFGINESAIFFVVVLGAAPSIANGLISGVDQIPPLWLRAGRVLGAQRLTLFRHVILPASLPAFVAGLKQGWAFAWRSLMAGELLVRMGRPSLGDQLEIYRELNDARALMAVMITILVIGIVVDALVFGVLERGIRRRRGLLETTS